MMVKMLFFFMYVMGILSFMLVRVNLLLMLLSLEMVMLSLFLFFMLVMIKFVGEGYFLMIFCIFMVSEAVIGLSILVSMVRMYGNDYFNSFNLLEC
uniref:NADH dehydrogenase subunit 4L n=1 Tax=Gunungiella wangi TaxID=3025506 RepID=UPI002435B3A9|nr:NADH dehydrogenase subunit 4L [Gunungiella wangi]WEU80072.1 NADH dehydrogenase subunit 4L [Gunungiella wangi]